MAHEIVIRGGNFELIGVRTGTVVRRGAFSGPMRPPLSRSKQVSWVIGVDLCLMGAFSGPKTRPAAVAQQTGRLTWIIFVMFEKSLFH